MSFFEKLEQGAYWKGLPFMLGQGIFLRLTGIAVPLLLLGVIGGFIRKKSYRWAVFVFLSALFFYAPVGMLASGMFLLLPLICGRFISEQILHREKV